jgi:hypothetical protein
VAKINQTTIKLVTLAGLLLVFYSIPFSCVLAAEDYKASVIESKQVMISNSTYVRKIPKEFQAVDYWIYASTAMWSSYNSSWYPLDNVLVMSDMGGWDLRMNNQNVSGRQGILITVANYAWWDPLHWFPNHKDATWFNPIGSVQVSGPMVWPVNEIFTDSRETLAISSVDNPEYFDTDTNTTRFLLKQGGTRMDVFVSYDHDRYFTATSAYEAGDLKFFIGCRFDSVNMGQGLSGVLNMFLAGKMPDLPYPFNLIVLIPYFIVMILATLAVISIFFPF